MVRVESARQPTARSPTLPLRNQVEQKLLAVAPSLRPVKTGRPH